MRAQVKTTVLLSALGLSVALNLSLGVGHMFRARAREPGGRVRGATSGRCLLDRLDLDARQRESLSVLRQTMRGKRAAFWRRAAALKAELAEAIYVSGSDRAQLDRLLEEFAQNQADMQVAVVDHLVSVKSMLHPGQREEFRTLLRTEMFRGIEPPTETVDEP